MEKTITFTIASNGTVSPLWHNGGRQGEDNVTNVKFIVPEALAALDQFQRVRVQAIDGAGGFSSTGFLTSVYDDVNAQYYFTVPLTAEVTSAGGIAHLYLVVTSLDFATDGTVSENQVLISKECKLRFDYSGIGGASEYAYSQDISAALVNAEHFANEAEASKIAAQESEANSYINVAKSSGYSRMASESADAAQQSSNQATDTKNDVVEIKGQIDAIKTDVDISKSIVNSQADYCVDLTNISRGYKNDAADSAAEAKGYADEVLGVVGDIETALDNIIAIQNALIGGES